MRDKVGQPLPAGHSNKFSSNAGKEQTNGGPREALQTPTAKHVSTAAPFIQQK